jgi:uncharacterized protein (TIGR02246 family)
MKSTHPLFVSRRFFLRSFTLAALIVGGFAGSNLIAASAPAAAKTEVESTFKKFVQGWEARNLDAVVANFTTDAVAFDPVGSGRFEGTEGIRGWVADTFKAVSDLAIDVSHVRIDTSGAVAWLTADYVFKGVVDGKPMSDPGHLSMVWVKQRDGAYKATVFHASPVPPPPPAPAK